MLHIYQLTGAFSDLLGQATFDTSYQEERELVTESCQSSTDHLRAGLIGLSNGVFGGLTSIFTQPVRGARDDGLGVSHPPHCIKPPLIFNVNLVGVYCWFG